MNIMIISISIIIGVVLLIAGYFGTNYYMKLQENNAEIQKQNTEIQQKDLYCFKWFNSIEERQRVLEKEISDYNNAGFWEQMQTDPDYLNQQAAALDQEGNQYNRECAY